MSDVNSQNFHTSLLVEQRYVLSYLFKRQKTPTECLAKLQKVYGPDTMSRSQVFDWFRQFKGGRKSAATSPRTGRRSEVTTDVSRNTISALLAEDCTLNQRQIAAVMGFSQSTVQRIIRNDLQMTRVCSHWVPHFLTREQLDLRIQISTRILARYEQDPEFLNRVITCDETWVYHFDPTTKQESSGYRRKGDFTRKKVRQQKSVGKVMLIAFFDRKGMIYQHIVPHTIPKTTVNSEYYIKVLKKLREHVQRKRPEISKSFILHQDNAPAHTSSLTRAFLDKWKIEVLGHPPYSPDLAPCDFWLFPMLKKHLRGFQFESNAQAARFCEEVFKATPPRDFESTIMTNWVARWKKCIANKGHYFEKDKNVNGL